MRPGVARGSKEGMPGSSSREFGARLRMLATGASLAVGLEMKEKGRSRRRLRFWLKIEGVEGNILLIFGGRHWFGK